MGDVGEVHRHRPCQAFPSTTQSCPGTDICLSRGARPEIALGGDGIDTDDFPAPPPMSFLAMVIFRAVSILARLSSHSPRGMPQGSNSQSVSRGVSLSRCLHRRIGASPAWLTRPTFCKPSFASPAAPGCSQGVPGRPGGRPRRREALTGSITAFRTGKTYRRRPGRTGVPGTARPAQRPQGTP